MDREKADKLVGDLVEEFYESGDGRRLLPALGRALEARGVRLIAASVGGGQTQVVVTAKIEDVSSSVVTDVVAPILRKAGIPDESVPMMAAMAGTGFSQWVKKRVRRGGAAGSSPTEASGDGPSSSPAGGRAWDPRARRRRR